MTSGRQKSAGIFRISDGCGKADSSRITARNPAETFNETERLQTSVAAQQGMDLVNHNEAKIAKQGRNLHMLVDEK